MAGMTLKSAAAAVFCLLAMAIAVQFLGVLDAPSSVGFGTQAFPLSALNIFAVLALLAALVWWAARVRVFQPTEMLWILYVLLLAAPLMSTGFWRFFLSAASTSVKNGDLEKYDVFSSRLWPKGEDLLEGVLARPGDHSVRVFGNVQWEEMADGRSGTRRVPVIANAASGGSGGLRFRLPVRRDGTVVMPLEHPYFFTMRVKPEGLVGNSQYAVRVYYDGEAVPDAELLAGRGAPRKTFLEPEGFVRVGRYGFNLPAKVRDFVEVEVVLQGQGRLAVADVAWMNVAAMEQAYSGRRMVDRATYERLDPAVREGLVVRPERLWSAEGLGFVVSGLVPWRAWRDPILLWSGYALCLLAAAFALASIFRKQWIQHERFPLPMAHVPQALAGLEADEEGNPVWKNPALWAGVVLMFAWAACRAWSAYLPGSFNVVLSVPVKSYFPDAAWGRTWDGVFFSFHGLAFAIGLFMELNVLLSFVAGYLLYRLQFWLGEANGLAVNKDYPHPNAQLAGSYLGYGLMLLVLARKHLLRVLRLAWQGGNPDGEVLSHRSALLLLGGALLGVAGLAVWSGFQPGALLAFTLLLLLAVLVAMKFRAECGMPGPMIWVKESGGGTFMVLFALLGSFSFWSPETAIFLTLFTGLFVTSGCFSLVPGLQMEWVAVGHKHRLKGRDIAGGALLAVAGAVVLGGWVYLSGAYATGAANYPVPGHFGGMRSAYSEFNKAAGQAHEAASSGKALSPLDGLASDEAKAFFFGTGVASALAVVRQWFAGFWFHPLGFVAGASQVMHDAWGSLLLAWLVRYAVLKLGGAASVRRRLIPFAIGCVVGIVLASVLTSLGQGWAYFFNPGSGKFNGAF